MMDIEEGKVPCKYCGYMTVYTGTKCCHDCWELQCRIPSKPATAIRILNDLEIQNGAKQFKTVGVKYATSQVVYTFMTDEECKVGDKAVVFTNGSWNVVTIVEIHDEPQLNESYAYTWLVQVVDRTNYDRHIQEDHEGRPSVGARL